MHPSFRRLSLILLCALVAAGAHAQPAARIVECRIGFEGRYRLGFWTPVRVTIDGHAALDAPSLEVVAPDCDGSPASLVTPLKEFTARVDGSTTTHHTLTRIGRTDASLLVRLWDGDTLIDTWRSAQERQAPARSLPATERLTVEVGSRASITGGAGQRVAVRVGADELPVTWLGYEGVDTLVVAGGEPEALAGMGPGDQRVAAIREWVERGGRLVIAVGASAQALIGEGAPFQSLAPGRLAAVAPLVRTESIEEFAEAAEPTPTREHGDLSVARLEGVDAQVEAYVGGRGDGAPLVVRSMRGFGTVTFVAIDLDAPVIQQWAAAPRFIQRILDIEARPGARPAAGGGALVTRGFNDLAGAAQVRLGESFRGVTTTPMTAIVAAVVAYLAIIGPGGYLLLKRVLGRMELVWVLFPLVLVAVGAAVYAWGERSTGEQARLNQLELVDVDCPTGFERGVAWAQVFSPRADRYDLSFALAGAAHSMKAPEHGFLSWYGLPGAGLGGMQAPADSLLATEAPYRITAAPSGLIAAPINLRATKSVTARWTQRERPVVRMDLERTGAGLVVGVLTNETGLDLGECKLLYDGWGWRLPAMPPGAVVSVDASVRPARFRTILMREFERERAAGARRSLDAMAHMMMFSEELGGADGTGLDNSYQSYCDLSAALRSGRPVLVARCAAPRARILRDGRELDPEQQTFGVFYRFVGAPPHDDTRRE